MSERQSLLFSLLKQPLIYETVQQAFGAERNRRWFAKEHVAAKLGDRILDIGCGPAHLLAHLPEVEFIGWEPNPAYVEDARARYGSRGQFHVGYFGKDDAAQLSPVDIAIVSAVLHHMSDEEARELFQLLRGVIKPGGKVITIDPVFAEGQNLIARSLISIDRGRNVRSPEGYRALALTAFTDVTGAVAHHRFPPYTHFVMTAR